jgi:hypothetical protein
MPAVVVTGQASLAPIPPRVAHILPEIRSILAKALPILPDVLPVLSDILLVLSEVLDVLGPGRRRPQGHPQEASNRHSHQCSH